MEFSLDVGEDLEDDIGEVGIDERENLSFLLRRL
jgi:hypothetical protein